MRRHRGAPADVAADAAGLIYNADQFGKGFFERGAIPAVLLSVAGNPSEMEMQRLGDRWKRMLGGCSGPGNVRCARRGAAAGGWAADQDLAMPERLTVSGRISPRRWEFRTAWWRATRRMHATAQADRLNLYDFTILPEATLVARMINTQVLQGTPWRFQFTPERMNIYQEDEGARSAAWATYVNAGMRHRWRRRLWACNCRPGWNSPTWTRIGARIRSRRRRWCWRMRRNRRRRMADSGRLRRCGAG